jgi:hypothetical protein
MPNSGAKRLKKFPTYTIMLSSSSCLNLQDDCLSHPPYCLFDTCLGKLLSFFFKDVIDLVVCSWESCWLASWLAQVCVSYAVFLLVLTWSDRRMWPQFCCATGTEQQKFVLGFLQHAFVICLYEEVRVLFHNLNCRYYCTPILLACNIPPTLRKVILNRVCFRVQV